MRKLTERELEDLIRGCAILGTGGGGSPRRGLALLKDELAQGREIALLSLEELAEDAWVASPYMCGSVSPEEEGKEELECLVAFEALEEFLGVKFAAAVATEIGGGNTAVAMAVAARKGIPTLDADPAGRSVPELSHTTFALKGIGIAPFAVATRRGDVIVVKEVGSEERAEAIARDIAIMSDNRAGVADHPVRGKDARAALIPGTLTLALRIGEAVRLAREKGSDPLIAAARAGNGHQLFCGRVQRYRWEIEGGFTVGEAEIAGTGEYTGHTYRVWFKNEHIISWFDGEPDVMAPDLICILDPATGEAITNPNLKEGQEVGVVGYPAPELWRTSQGIALLGPRHFGFDLDFRPLEENPRLSQ